MAGTMWEESRMHDQADTALARRLRELMEAQQIKQKGLALKAGLNETYVRDLLKGKSRSPEASKLAQVENALGVAPGTLLSLTPVGAQAEIVTDIEEQILLRAWRKLSDEHRVTALSHIRFLTANQTSTTADG